MLLAVVAALSLSVIQSDALLKACELGKPHGLCETMQAIILQESSACHPAQLVGDDGTSFGCGGLKLSTARMYDPKVTAKQLVNDRDRNLRITLRNLLACRERHGKSWRRMVVCHNGPARAIRKSDTEIARDPYLWAVGERLLWLRKYQAERL